MMKKLTAAILLVMILIPCVAYADNYVTIKDTTMSDVCGLIYKVRASGLVRSEDARVAYTENLNPHAAIAGVYLDILNQFKNMKFDYNPKDENRAVAYIGYVLDAKAGLNDVLLAFYYKQDKYYLGGYNYDSNKLYYYKNKTYSSKEIENKFVNICNEYMKFTGKEISGQIEVFKLQEKDKRKKK